MLMPKERPNKLYKCCKCKEHKPNNEFYLNRTRHKGLQDLCKLCDRKRQQKYRHTVEGRFYNNKRSRDWHKKKRKDKCWAAYRSVYARSRLTNIRYFNQKEFETWYIKQEKICVYCGLREDDVLKIIKRGNHVRLEIDRKNNEHGYTLKNICLACPDCNLIKNDILTFDEMRFIGNNFVRPKHIAKLGV